MIGGAGVVTVGGTGSGTGKKKLARASVACEKVLVSLEELLIIGDNDDD